MKFRVSNRFISPILALFGAFLPICLGTAQNQFTTLHSFTALQQPYYFNGDGALPDASLVVVGNSLYGTEGFS